MSEYTTYLQGKIREMTGSEQFKQLAEFEESLTNSIKVDELDSQISKAFANGDQDLGFTLLAQVRDIQIGDIQNRRINPNIIKSSRR